MDAPATIDLDWLFCDLESDFDFLPETPRRLQVRLVLHRSVLTIFYRLLFENQGDREDIGVS